MITAIPLDVGRSHHNDVHSLAYSMQSAVDFLGKAASVKRTLLYDKQINVAIGPHLAARR
ncbi:MAG: hypothetical protein QOF51_2458 [Chloroflexota bacterium]|nr:hypothetical protein [Chloroflexota bacterium]